MEGDREWSQKYNIDTKSSSSPSRELRRSSTQETFPIRSKKPQSAVSSSTGSNIPTPPSSSSPTSSSFHPSNPFSNGQLSPVLFEPTLIESTLEKPERGAPRIQLSPAPSVPFRERPPSYRSSAPSGKSSGRPRASSARSPNAADLEAPAQGPQRSVSQNHRTHRRNISLPQRYPGDMSGRPLDTIKKETKVANRSHRHRRGPSQPDSIDALDTIGGGYHHDGPYEATLASRNINTKYSPVAAVHDSNMEAIRATPQEYIQDSLVKHVPLQGTAVVPNGGLDMRGQVMDYEEGADLMREDDAEGGAYKRYDFVPYHPEDYKGKGEPSFTLERDLKAKKAERFLHPEQQSGDIELQYPGRQRSRSNGAYDASSSGLAVPGDDGMQRSNTTGKRLSDGLKRRFGSLRKKKDMPAEQI